MSRLNTAEEVEAIVGRAPSVIRLKQINALDDGCRVILAASPVAAFGYRDAAGISRTTFVGGRRGFARVDSPTRISFSRPEAHGPVSLFFLLPGIGEILRVNGVAHRGAVDIREAFVHCAQAVLRSRLWQPPVAPATTPTVVDGPLGNPGVAEFLAAAPFLALSTWDNNGGSDTSPRGDRHAAARILDGRTLVIPDRKGNKRTDTLHNLLQDDRLSLAALVPGRTGVLHVRGRGAITADPALLETMALRGMPPHAALLINVEHAEVTANDAIVRSRLWTPAAHVDRGAVPDLMALAGVHLAANTAPRTGLLLRLPGVARLMRFVMNRAYQAGLHKEGYDDVGTGLRAENPGSHDDVTIVEVRRETPSAVTLVLENATGTPFDFRPGQFFTLVTDIDGRPVRRAYSASCAPGSPRLEVTVKRVEGGRFSTRTFRPGDRLTLRGPSGSFHARPGDKVFLAAGSGITPIMSMIRSAAPGEKMSLLYSSRTTDDIIYAADLEKHPLSVTHVLTSRSGRLDAARIKQWVTELAPADNAHYYVCGPEPLMEAAVAALDVAPDRIHLERYAAGCDPSTPTTVPQTMTVHDNGHPVGSVVVEPGQTLLDAGLEAGFPMPYSCTVGNCGDCMVQLHRGDVLQNEPNCLTPHQKAARYTLACVSRPLSNVTVDIGEP